MVNAASEWRDRIVVPAVRRHAARRSDGQSRLVALLYDSPPRNIRNLNTMNQKPFLALADVKRIAAACEAEALRLKLPVSIAIADDGGHLLWLQRLDGAAPVSAHIAPAKANTAALGRRESRLYEEMINQGRTAFLSAPAIDGMLEGGLPLLADGHCIGAVGISGAKPAEDTQIAQAGVAALG